MMKIAKVYYCDEYDFDYERLLPLLPQERQDKFRRLRFEKDRKNCVGSYMLLLKGMKDYGIGDFEMKYNANSKPYIKGNPLFFNLSHSKNGFACAVHNKEIGVDMQEVVLAKKTTLKKVCSEKELAIVADNELAFTKLWTFKESIVKRKGETIAYYGKYEFPELNDDFYAYGNHFAVKTSGDYVITVCGDYEKVEFIKVKSVEL